MNNKNKVIIYMNNVWTRKLRNATRNSE